MSVDEFLDEIPSGTTAGGHRCLCSHRHDWHRHGDNGRRCIRPCGCNGFRTDEQDETAAREAG